MATHSSTLAWKIPWTEEPGSLQSRGQKESDTTERLHSLTISSVRPAPNIHSLPGSYSLTPLFCQNIYYFLFICILYIKYYLGFPGGSDSKESAPQCRRPEFDPWVGKIPWRIYYWVLKLFIFGCAGSLLLHGLLSSCSVQVSHFSGFSLWSTGCSRTGSSSCGSQALEHRLNSCGTQA